MKTINTIIFGISLLFFLAFTSHSQTGRLKYAEKMYDQKAYYFASEAYEDVLARKTDSSTVAIKIADSYDKLGNVQKAASWYRYLKRKDKIEKEGLLRLALLEHQLGNYDQSKTLLSSYSSKYGESEVVENILNADVSIDELNKDKGWFSVKRQAVNTEYSEMGTSFISENEVLFSSSKGKGGIVNRVDSWTGDAYYNIYKAQVAEDGNLSDVKQMKAEAKTRFHDGIIAYNEKTGYVYFTRNNFIDGKTGMDKDKVIHLKLYRAKLDGNKFKNVVELGVNDDSYSTAHPSISKDGKTLYFSSNRPGGYGGMDIYSVKLDASGLPIGTPVNLGAKVNTPKDEVFSHYNSKYNLLFFSSNGHFGLGGLDVFVARLDGEGKAKNIENLGTPINSPLDDFSYMSDENQTKGYFSSNRQGGKGSDDIYGFDQHVVIANGAVLKGKVKNLLTEAGVEGAMIYLADKDGNLMDSIQSNQDGAYEMALDGVENDFLVIIEKNGYVEFKEEVKYDREKDEYHKDLEILPNLDYHFTGLIKDRASKENLEGVKITFYDRNKDSEEFDAVLTGTDGTFKTKTIPYEYNDHVNYEIKLEKDGYVTKNVALGDILSKKEAMNVSEYLSLDMTKIEVGKTDLHEVVEINDIHFDFNKSDIRPDAAKELDKVVKVMQDNPGMVIELRAYTDQRGNKDYNLKLSDRRAKSSAQYIISRGIAKDRVRGKGYGAASPIYTEAEIAKETSEEAREALYEKNRRTEFIIVKMNK